MNALKQQVIEHWQRMIRWASKQPKNRVVDIEVMGTAIKEVWLDSGCAWCKWYEKKVVMFYDKCILCPMQKKYGKCTHINKNLWNIVHGSKTWGEWTINARLFLKQIKTI